MFGSCQAIFTNVLGMKHAAAKIIPKFLYFEQCRMDIAQELLTTFYYDPDLLKNVVTGDESWLYGYDIITIIPIEVSKRAKAEKITAIAWGIMNSCHKVLLSIRNTTLKLCADCEKQFIRNAQNCGEPIMDFAS